MAERWQQWMPFHIDRFRGSPDVQAMHPAARMGYLYLLASAWQTDDCTISDDPLDLASMSGLGDDLWAQYCPRILRKFEPAGTPGRLYNPVLLEEWTEAKRIFEKNHGPKLTPEEISEARSKAGKAGAEARWHKHGKEIANASENDGKPIANDGYTGTGTGTNTKPQKQKPSRPPKADRVPDPRHSEFRSAFRAYFLHRNPGLQDEPWDEQEAFQLSRFLKKNPRFTTEQWQTLLQNRARSNVIHGENLSAWIGRALTWATKSNGGTYAKPNRAADIADSTNATLALRRSRALDAQADSDGGGANPVTTARSLFERPHAQLVAQNSGGDR